MFFKLVLKSVDAVLILDMYTYCTLVRCQTGVNKNIFKQKICLPY